MSDKRMVSVSAQCLNWALGEMDRLSSESQRYKAEVRRVDQLLGLCDRSRSEGFMAPCEELREIHEALSSVEEGNA